MSFLSHILDTKISHLLIKKVIRHYHNKTIFVKNTTRKGSSIMTENKSNAFFPKRALVLRKFSRLEYERLCYPNLTEEQLASNVSVKKVKPTN